MSMHLGEATIGTGATGAEVKTIQQILSGQGYNVGPIDGIFGPQTQSAVQAFQKLKGLLPDGIIGPMTWAALQGAPPTPTQLPPPVQAVAPISGMGSLGTYAMIGVAALVALTVLGGRK